MLTRRKLMATTMAVAPIALVLSACGTKAPSADQLSADAGLIGSGIATLLDAIGMAGIRVSDSIRSTVNALVADIQLNAAGISGALGSSGAAISTIMADLKEVATVVGAFFPQATLAYDILSAAVALGQYIYSLIKGASAAVMGAFGGTLKHYTPAEARAMLKAAA